MKIKSILLSLLLGLGAGKAAAQQITVSPIPQNIEWGAKAFDGTATYKFTGSEEADADAVAALTAFRAPQTGSADVEIIIGERGDAAVAAYESEIPAKAEGYYLKVEPGKVVIAGNDANGTFYGVQTFLQVAAQPEVMQVTVKDWPDMLERGVVEGFYGNNWSQTDRIRQFQFYGRNKMNVYIYGPKDDPYHRYRWRENYPTAEANKMKELVAEAHKNKVNFVWAVHPGIDIKWNKTDSLNVIKKLEFMYGLGVRAFAVFFDDITGEGTSGVKQAQLLNYITDEFVRKHEGVQPLILCPTDYNRAWAGDTYLNALRDNMYKEVRIMWTGNSVVDFINKSDLEWVNPRIGRKAYIWLNYPVTDYCGRHLLMGPTFGDDLDIADMVSGYTSNPMEYAEASMLSLYSIADFTWHEAAYDCNASWERAIKYLMPTHAEAFHVFCEHNVDLGANGHGLRRMNESVAFKAAAEAFKTAIANGYNAEAVKSMKQQFAIITNAADELLANTDQPELTAEITPWVQVMKIVGQRGALTMALYDNLQAAEPEKFIENYLAITALEQQQKSVMSRDFEGSIMKVNPAVAELVVQPFIKEQLAALIAAYKKTYDYRLDVFPAELIEEGDYFIKYNNRYLSNTNAGSVGGNPSFLSSLDNVNPTRQYWHISLDPTTSRYKIVNVKDSRYLNENGAFSAGDSNPYEAGWHTYNLYRMNGKYAIQNAGSAGNKFWKASSTRISQGTSNELNNDQFIFELVPVAGAVEHPTIEEGKEYAIMDAQGRYLTNTNSGGSGGNPTFRTKYAGANKAQAWKFSVDATTKRWKLVNAKDGRYVNEYANFGTNEFFSTWNTYIITELGGLFSIRNAGEAGTNYWYIDSSVTPPRINAKAMDAGESYQFSIVDFNVATGINRAATTSGADGTLTLRVVGGELHVDTPAAISSMTLFSADGRTLRTERGTAAMSVAGMNGGVYLLSVETADGIAKTFRVQLK